MPAHGQWRGTIEEADVVESQEPALENIPAFRILAIDPPGEVQQELLKDPGQKSAIALATEALFDFVHPPGSPGMDGRIHIAEGPFIGGNLSIGMHVPFAQKEDELFLGKIRID